jgi:hypothetical protein
MAGLGDLFGKGSIAEQLFVWGVLNQIIGALAGPYFEELQHDVNVKHPVGELSPAELADATVRNFLAQGDAASHAQKSGLTADKFALLVHLAGEAPGPLQLAVALRRGLIPEGGTGAGSISFTQGISEGRLANKWAETIKRLAVEWPTPTDALEALLEGQISEAEGRALYEKFGGDPDYFTMLFNTRGQAPTPMEALEMARRGIIPWEGTGPASVSFHQAFLEGPWRNKWLTPFRELGVYVPPSRTISALLRAGSITESKAAELWAKQGLEPDLIKAFINDATKGKAATSRDLTRGEIEQMHEQHILSDAQATDLLHKLGYDPHEAELIITSGNVRRATQAVNSAVTRIRTLFVGHKIVKAAAVSSLTALGITSQQVSAIIRTWELEESINVRQLTPAQITGAWDKKIISESEALSELEAIGYTPRDAWILLSEKHGSKLPGEPGRGPGEIAIA